MQTYRYRASCLVGPWRRSAEEAARDAVAAGQAETDGSGPHGIRWRVTGMIERGPQEEDRTSRAA